MSDIKVLDIVVNKDATNYKYINALKPDAREVMLELVNKNPDDNIIYTDIDSFIIIELIKLGAVPVFSLVKQELVQNTIKMPITTYGINVNILKQLENSSDANKLNPNISFDNMVEIISKNTDMTILYFFVPMFLLKRIGYGLYNYLTISDQLGFTFNTSIMRGILPPIIPFKFNQNILQKQYSEAILADNEYLKYKTLFHHSSAAEIYRLLKYFTDYFAGIETMLSYKIRNHSYYTNRDKFVKMPGVPYDTIAPTYVKLDAELSNFIKSINAVKETTRGNDANTLSVRSISTGQILTIKAALSIDAYFVDLFNKGLSARFLLHKLGDIPLKSPATLVNYNIFNRLNIFNIDDLIRDIYNKRAIKKLFGDEFLNTLVKKYGDFNTINFVTKKDRSAIENEVARIKELEKANKENDCAHVKLTATLSQLKSNQAIYEFLINLMPFIADSKMRANLNKLLNSIKGKNSFVSIQPRTAEAAQNHQEVVGGKPYVNRIGGEAEDSIDKLVKRYSLVDDSTNEEEQDKRAHQFSLNKDITSSNPIASETIPVNKKNKKSKKIKIIDTDNTNSDNAEDSDSSEESEESEESENSDIADITVVEDKTIYRNKVSTNKVIAKHNPIYCNVCGLYLICPHSLYLLEYQIGLIATYEELRELLEPLYSYSIDTKYTECVICSEQLFIKENFEVTIKPALIHGIRERDIWRDAQDFVYKFVLIKDVFNKQRIIEDMVNTCYPYIADKLLNYKNYNNVSNYRSIFGKTLFASYLLNVTKKHPNKLLFDFNKYLENVPIQEKTSTIKEINQYREIFSKVVVNEQEFVITKQHIYINDFDYCFIASLLVNKYPVTVSNALKLLPIEYFASLNIQNDYNKKRSKISAKSNKISTKKRVGNILDDVISDDASASIETAAVETVTKKTIYSTLKPVIVGDFGKLMEQRIPIHTFGARSPLRPDDLREVIFKLIYNKNIKFLTSNVWYTSLTVVEPNSPDFTPPAILDAIDTINARLCLRSNIISLRPTISLPVPYGYTKRPRVTLNTLFHEETIRRHKWDYLVYIASELPPGYVEKNELKQIKDNRVAIKKRMANMRELGGILPVDKYSSITDTLQSETYLDNSDINSAIYAKYIKNNERNNIEIYYTNKCPVTKALHEISGDICTKCGKRTTMSEEELDAYYAKYADTYAREKEEKAAADNVWESANIRTFEIDNKKSLEGALDTNANILEEFIYEEDRYNEMVNTFSLLIGVNVNQLKYMGQLEGSEFSVVTQPNFIPKTMKNRQNYNIRLLNSWIIGYFQFRNSNNIASAQFSVYNNIYKKAHTRIEPNLLIKQMRYLLFHDMMQLNKVNSALCVKILKEIINDDKLLCKNQPIVQKALPDDLFTEEPDILEIEEKMMNPNTESEGAEVKDE